jgi:hypothetical protein
MIVLLLGTGRLYEAPQSAPSVPGFSRAAYPGNAQAGLLPAPGRDLGPSSGTGAGDSSFHPEGERKRARTLGTCLKAERAFLAA